MLGLLKDLMNDSQVVFERTPLRELLVANRTTELLVHVALKLLMSPQRGVLSVRFATVASELFSLECWTISTVLLINLYFTSHTISEEVWNHNILNLKVTKKSFEIWRTMIPRLNLLRWWTLIYWGSQYRTLDKLQTGFELSDNNNKQARTIQIKISFHVNNHD